MKQLVFILFVISAISCNQKKGNNTKNNSDSSEETTGMTSIEFSEEIHDFANLISGEIVLCTFVFTNTGEHQLVINKIKTDCGCIQTNYPKEPVSPGKKGVIEVEFNSSGMFGKQFKSIEILANCKEPKHLAIFANIENEQIEIKY